MKQNGGPVAKIGIKIIPYVFTLFTTFSTLYPSQKKKKKLEGGFRGPLDPSGVQEHYVLTFPSR